MSTTDSPRAPAGRGLRASRSDGAEARQRLLLCALSLFAQKGFAKTSTREIAQAAGANIAAISYYFGDKAGLYAACFNEPLCGDANDLAALQDATDLPAREALRLFLLAYVQPLKQGEIMRQCTRLHLREMLEPTSQWAKEVERDIKGPHGVLVNVLSRHLGVAPDDDVHRLAFAITGLALQLFVTHDFIDVIRPSLVHDAAAIDRWADRLVRYAHALLDDEVQRRAASAQAAAFASPGTPPAASPKPSRRRASSP
ncbi:CerR family C-terminal domain-containing protein [Xenophilus arseniciresistens]|uniref:CerR family C-terminal domain-containing protein n=1 Tax=Xenophilus arseniciresistens TaxID=1283306 RepID=A0AAE3NDC4_9BURK|nr:CerR family C-terminal domain-containing protein [Xenophilus arseniciresistens]MDA7417539.1 CerR family C-terminal domain-containing protein [Xenophilus arseniciresistens]